MFTIFNPCLQEECVYNLVEPPRQIPAAGPPLYRSLFSCKVREDHYSRKCAYRTMGVPKVWPNSPDCYLKKHSYAPISIRPLGVPRLQIVKDGPAEKDCPVEKDKDACCEKVKDECPRECARKPAPVCPEMKPCRPVVECKKKSRKVKCRTEKKLCECLGRDSKPTVPSPCTGFGIVPTNCKDYITQNARNAIRQVAKKPALRFVDDCRGTTKNWCTSGLPRMYVNGDNFGKVPCYLEGIKQDLYEKDLMKKDEMKQKDCDMQEKCRHLEPIERQAIACGLKKNWEEIFAEYQALPLNIDTPGKVETKSELEKELKRLESDIQLIERHDHVFVADTNRSFYLA